mgnify:CR=1 FL=1
MAHFLIISDGTFSLMYDYNTENHLYFYRIDRNALIMDFNQQYIMYKLIERMILKDEVNIDLSNKKIYAEISDNWKSVRVAIGDFGKNSNVIKKRPNFLKRLFHKIFW